MLGIRQILSPHLFLCALKVPLGMDKLSPMRQLMENLPQLGRVEWIGVRPARAAAMIALPEVFIDEQMGLAGDRFAGRPDNPRQVTLIQQEHLAVLASCLGRSVVQPTDLRRNIVISGINLLALKNRTFRLGDTLLECTGLCHPCSKMEKLLGPGGYNAMRGHGGVTARVSRSGLVRLGDNLTYPGL